MKHLTWYFLSALVLCGTQSGNAQHKDPSPLEGFQIRPLESFLKVGQSQVVNVRNCVQYKEEGVDELYALLFECDPSAFDIFPLLNMRTISKWSVNGIEGGSSEVGRIIDQGKYSALYTAPTHKPKSGRIEVSTEIETEGKGKTLLVASIIILEDARIYHGTVEIHGKGDGVIFNAFGQITFKETGYNTGSFNSISGLLAIQYEVEDCSRFKGVLPLAGELYLYETDEDKSLAGGSDHSIAFFTDSFDINCHGIDIPQGLLQVLSPCETAYGKNKGDGILLVGSGTCGGIDINWKLEGQ